MGGGDPADPGNAALAVSEVAEAAAEEGGGSKPASPSSPPTGLRSEREESAGEAAVRRMDEGRATFRSTVLGRDMRSPGLPELARSDSEPAETADHGSEEEGSPTAPPSERSLPVESLS